MLGRNYISNVTDNVRRAYEEQTDILRTASEWIAGTVEAKRNVFVFGCSHAGILAEEVFYRTGGLAVMNPIFYPDLMLDTRPVTDTSRCERTPGVGQLIVEQNELHEGDLLILHSVSGRNNVPVDMANAARERGVRTICITNLAYSSSVSSRHPSGKRLFEVCDLVIDNKGEIGDTSVQIPGLPERIGPTSTVVGAAVINALVIDAVEKMVDDGFVPPVFLSANLDGGDEHNARIFEEYGENIFYM
ncbi:MAG: SIS domain-containing protein [Clostridia bacterium]|nr:SIS domain-containing protein [Clostridia bacterium]